MWQYTGTGRPDFAVEPEAGQESVWDYPRPPVLGSCARVVRVIAGETEVARSERALRVLETASPPTVYLPPEDIVAGALVETAGGSVCEWKGVARYFALAEAAEMAVAWSYPAPSAAFRAIKDYVSFYPARIACYLDDERVRPQGGGFYGGWVTADIVGPWKGEADTGAW
ncbi:MAG: DUF427 domain-containing protein [Gammaproteobacteria bacterium]|nr:DUF427 domain-containing protein [Gammaproteobacteria bacterium]